MQQPYRQFFDSPPEKLIVWPDARLRTLLPVGAFLLIMIGAMMVFGSSITDILCRRTGESMTCTTVESTLVSSSRFEQTSTGVTSFTMRSSVTGKSRKEWMTMDSPKGGTGVTTTSVPTVGREQALLRLNAFARDASQGEVQTRFGARWGGLQTLPFLCIGLGFLYLIMGSRVTLTVQRRQGRARVESRLWPLAPRGIDFALDAFDAFKLETSSKNSTRIALTLLDGTSFPLTRSYTSFDKSAAVWKLEEFIRMREASASPP